MKLIVISPSGKNETEIAFVQKMFEMGLPCYHVRKTEFSTRSLKKLLQEIPEKYHNRIVIHTHHNLALRFKLRGIYLSYKHKKGGLSTFLKLKWLDMRRENIRVSTTIRQPEALLDHDPKYDYVMLSPVFDSLSGNFQAGFSENSLKNLLSQTKYKVIARGGISVDTLQRAHELGFSGVAFYSGIWKTPSPVEEFRKVMEKFRELKIEVE